MQYTTSHAMSVSELENKFQSVFKIKTVMAQIPRKLGGPSPSRADAFLKVSNEVHHSDEEKMTVNDLITKMKHYLGDGEEPYSFPFMKEQLQSHFGNDNLISGVNGKKECSNIPKDGFINSP